MANHYVTVEAVKRAAQKAGPLLDAVIFDEIAAASREIDRITHRRFIPLAATRAFRWPQDNPGRSGSVLHLDEDLLSVSALTIDGDSATPISASDYFLEPATFGPPYSRIELDLSSSAQFSANTTPQRAIRVTGLWGYPADLVTAGALSGAINGTVTAAAVSDGAKVGVGDSLLCGSEQMFVVDKGLSSAGATLTGSLTAVDTEQTIPVSSGAAFHQGETIQIDAERMFVYAITGNNLSVLRAQDGTARATHTSGATVYAMRALTLERGVNGSTAAAHDDAASLSRFVVPDDVAKCCRALAMNALAQNAGAWSGTVGSGEAALELRGLAIKELRERVIKGYRRHSIGVVGGAR